MKSLKVGLVLSCRGPVLSRGTEVSHTSCAVVPATGQCAEFGLKQQLSHLELGNNSSSAVKGESE